MTVSISSSRDSNTLLWPPTRRYTCGKQRYMLINYPDIKKKNKSKQGRKEGITGDKKRRKPEHGRLCVLLLYSSFIWKDGKVYATMSLWRSEDNFLSQFSPPPREFRTQILRLNSKHQYTVSPLKHRGWEWEELLCHQNLQCRALFFQNVFIADHNYRMGNSNKN